MELFALRALQGEILIDQDPAHVPQSGYCHAYDCVGAAWLHEHVETNYNFCWQQALADGEWDAAVCDIGTSRWFNYYIEGLYWSARHAPYINGIYYDGINFDRRSMRRVRKVLDRAAKETGRGVVPLIDIHTGYQEEAPPALMYHTHMAYANSLWNGEGFQFSLGPYYWLYDVSGFQHGLPADRLGSSQEFKGMLFGTYRRNSKQASGLWQLWDQVGISMMGKLHQVNEFFLAFGCARACVCTNVFVFVCVRMDADMSGNRTD